MVILYFRQFDNKSPRITQTYKSKPFTTILIFCEVVMAAKPVRDQTEGGTSNPSELNFILISVERYYVWYYFW